MSKLIIYLKSGNIIVADKVRSWKVKTDGNQIVGLAIDQNKNAKNHVVVTSIDFNSIECIVEKKE